MNTLALPFMPSGTAHLGHAHSPDTTWNLSKERVVGGWAPRGGTTEEH